jgi:paraquat-inducible protein B
VHILRRYANLVRKGTKFWDVSGVDIRAGLFRGLEIDVASLKSLVSGGIEFATPNEPKDGPAKGGTAFPLHDKPKKEWLGWSLKTPIPPESP